MWLCPHWLALQSELDLEKGTVGSAETYGQGVPPNAKMPPSIRGAASLQACGGMTRVPSGERCLRSLDPGRWRRRYRSAGHGRRCGNACSIWPMRRACWEPAWRLWRPFTSGLSDAAATDRDQALTRPRIDLVPALACTLMVFTIAVPGNMCGTAAWTR